LEAEGISRLQKINYIIDYSIRQYTEELDASPVIRAEICIEFCEL